MGKHFFLNKGFTLIELAIATFVFTLLAFLAGGVVVRVLNIQRKAFNIQELESNARFIFEQLSREIRVADDITTADTNCPTAPSSTIDFDHPILGSVNYYVQNGVLWKNVNGTDSALSSGDIKVNSIAFCIRGNSSGDQKQPRVTVTLDMEKGKTSPTTAHMTVQTSVSQRFVND